MKNYLLSILMLLAVALTFNSCDKNEAISQEYDVDLLQKFIEKSLPNSTLELHSNPVEREAPDCAPPSGPNCNVFNFTDNFSVNISDCSTSVTDPCDVLAEMTITICVDPATGDISTTFEESVFGHAQSCIINHDDHTDDWECLSNLVYNEAINRFMPFILAFFQVDNNCRGGNRTVVAEYIQEVCTFPCTETIPGTPWSISRLVQCGASTACCVQETNWCVNEKGEIETTEGPKVLIGTCTPALPPCNLKKGDLWPMNGLQCAPRSCR